MKWTTTNVKNPNYLENHEIYVGTCTGSFKKLVPAYEEKPFAQSNLYDFGKLDKTSKITALNFGNENNSEILIGRGNNEIEIHSLRSDSIERTVKVANDSVVGIARLKDTLVVGFENGQIQILKSGEDEQEVSDSGTYLTKSGDHMSHLRQCLVQRNYVATGGKERQNNLKVFDIEADGKQIFTSKNLPNDYLQLEVPIWDSDVGFIDSPHILATCSRFGYVRVYDTRKQRRPIQYYSTEDQMAFTSLIASGNYIYTGTTMGALKAFDIRKMKNFVHTYKGLTGGLTDLHLDPTGKFLASSCLDRYVRVHHVDSCVLQYQCYVKSKANRILLRESKEKLNINLADDDRREEEIDETTDSLKAKKRKSEENVSEDEDYEAMFGNMPTIRENEDGTVEESENVRKKNSKAKKNMQKVMKKV